MTEQYNWLGTGIVITRPTPQRVQLRRVRGWRMPAQTKIVARPSRWRNPYSVAVHGLEESRRLFLAYLAERPDLVADAKRDLRGYNLACWCPEGAEWCHADVWLAIVNESDE